MKFGLREDIIQKINSVFELHPEVEEVIVYGSRAKGNYRNGSDIDLTLKGNKLNLNILGKINFEIDDLLLPWKMDISIYHHISNPDLIEHIDRVGKVFYKSIKI